MSPFQKILGVAQIFSTVFGCGKIIFLTKFGSGPIFLQNLGMVQIFFQFFISKNKFPQIFFLIYTLQKNLNFFCLHLKVIL